MQKEKKIKYPIYKYEAYKNLNKLFFRLAPELAWY